MREKVEVKPMDEHNETLVRNVHPPDWTNPEPAPRYNLVVIGAGTAGLVTAIGAAGLGARVALVERHLLGGDCLNTGCVPSKSIIRSSRVRAELRDAAKYGIRVPAGAEVDFAAVMRRMRRLRAVISAHDSAKRYRDLGVDVFLGEGRFSGRDAVEVEGETLRFRKAVIATGSRAVRPTIEGLEEAGYLTNENVFSLTERPRRLAVIGAGPIGCELAQAFRRLGSEVTLFYKYPRLMNREDPDAADILLRAFVREGIQVVLESRVVRVSQEDGGKVIYYERQGREEKIKADEILVGVGRAPTVEGLNLEVVGVQYDLRKGIRVSERLQTTNPRIYAAGDVCLPDKFTHAADAAARIVIQNALFLGRKRHSSLTIPRCTYTDPEIAHVGMDDQDARERGIDVLTIARPLREVDRAITDEDEEGFVKVHATRKGGRILGATIVARHAGDMISEITLAMVGKLGLSTIANVIHPYPTQAEAIKQAADAYNRTRLTPMVKSFFSRWLTWTR